MPVGIFRVCLMVIAAIVNQPLFFPQENCTVPEHAEDIIQKMKEQEERLRLAQLRLEQEVAEAMKKKEKHEWVTYIALSMSILLVIKFWMQDFQERMGQDNLGNAAEIAINARVLN